MKTVRAIFLLLLASVLSAFAQTTLLGPTPYLSSADSPFTSLSVVGYFHLEDFEDGLFNVPGVTANTGTVISFAGYGTLVDSVDGDNGPIDGLGNSGHSLFGGGVATFTFNAVTLGTLPTHAGIVLTDGTNGYTFEAFGPGMISLGTIISSGGDGNITGGTAGDRFYGFYDAGGILAIQYNFSGSWELDHLQYGTLAAIPEPATYATLLGLGALGLAAWRRKQRAM